MSGTLYLVATPIGNLKDISQRCIDLLQKVDIIFAEDTRRALNLLTHFGISKPLRSLFEHNERQRSTQIVNALKSDRDVALISDGGSPGISDPGYPTVRAAIEQGVEVKAIPGPCAAITALMVSALPTHDFRFIGFLPRSSRKRIQQLEQLTDQPTTLILYESPRRLLRLLEDLKMVMGDVPVAVCRELTKLHEEVKRGSAAELVAHFSKQPPRGECTVVVDVRHTRSKRDARDRKIAAIVSKFYLAKGMSVKETAQTVSKLMGISRSRIYRFLLKKVKTRS